MDTLQETFNMDKPMNMLLLLIIIVAIVYALFFYKKGGDSDSQAEPTPGYKLNETSYYGVV